MSDSDKWDRLLRQALASDAEPEEQLNRYIINRYREGRKTKPPYIKRFSIGVLVTVCMLVMSMSAFAAIKLISSQQIAGHLGEELLAEAFASSNAVEINESVVSKGYEITLHGIVSGAGLQELESPSSDLSPEKTYAVVSIAKADGSPMPTANDLEYKEVPFFVSPLIKGLEPWRYNLASMHGTYSEIVTDGIMYRIIECDEVEMFADKGVYLAIISGSSFFSIDAITYDEKTGKMSVRPDYQGVSVLFDLPLDKSKADPAKADAYLRKLMKPEETDGDSAVEMARKAKQWKIKFSQGKGTTIPGSVQKVTYDEQGRIIYKYGDWKIKIPPDQLPEEQTGDIPIQFSEREDGKVMVLVFTVEDNGDITGKVVEVEH
ncbi:hypothetical protein DNH61_04285 [Paenibacillus sambharensis]|uniref:DUF4179 domain-containing protein n=1 Tax=Paenibacillus sambharensis TaxID=1803190 RepID=A0A2W1LE79_9BACL|nr:hypothetical protein [Paenibacillus sambharensis]PZD97113.1 hypothetical protein DNH61_04285 [Paenibacillus sambharensis]